MRDVLWPMSRASAALLPCAVALCCLAPWRSWVSRRRWTRPLQGVGCPRGTGHLPGHPKPGSDHHPLCYEYVQYQDAVLEFDSGAYAGRLYFGPRSSCEVAVIARPNAELTRAADDLCRNEPSSGFIRDGSPFRGTRPGRWGYSEWRVEYDASAS
jgi:hypothetical protein